MVPQSFVHDCYCSFLRYIIVTEEIKYISSVYTLFGDSDNDGGSTW